MTVFAELAGPHIPLAPTLTFGLIAVIGILMWVAAVVDAGLKMRRSGSRIGIVWFIAFVVAPFLSPLLWFAAGRWMISPAVRAAS